MHTTLSTDDVSDRMLTPTQSHIAAIWADVLQQPCIALEDNFYSLGGDSMLMMMILFRVHEELGVELPPGILLESPTVLQCSELVEAELVARTVLYDTSNDESPDNMNKGVI